MSKTRIDERFKPEKYGTIFCPNCSGSGKSFIDARRGNVCKVYGGFGLVKREEKKGSRTKDALLNCVGEFVPEET